MSKRQQIIDELKTMLESIQTTNGYYTDIGKNTTPWRTESFTEDELPGASWRDQNADATMPEKHNVHVHTINIEYTAYCKGDTSPETARMIIEDLHQALGKNPYITKLAIRTVPGKNTIELEQDNKVIARIVITFQIVYVTKPWEI
jgi:hypothetical protein